MFKYKKLFVVAGVIVISCVMWLVSACMQLEGRAVLNKQAKSGNLPIIVPNTTTEPPKLSKSTTIINSTPTQPSVPANTTTTEPPSAVASTPAATTPTPSVPSIVTTPATTTNTPFYDVDINSYTLNIDGMVNSNLSLSYAQIIAYPSTTQTARIICPGEEDETDQWTGVPLSTLLDTAGVSPEATEVVITGLDGYYTQLPLATVLDSSVFLAYQINGQTLTWDRGYPLRLILGKSFVGADMPRWVSSIEVKSTLISYSNPSTSIQNARSNIPTSGNKLCSCFISATVVNYEVVQHQDLENNEDNSLLNQQKL